MHLLGDNEAARYVKIEERDPGRGCEASLRAIKERSCLLVTRVE